MKRTLFVASLFAAAVCFTTTAMAEGTYDIPAGETVTYTAEAFTDYTAINVAGTLNTNNQAIAQAITLQTDAHLTSGTSSWGDGALVTGKVLLEGNADISGKGINFGGEVDLNGNTLTVKSMSDAGVYFRSGSSLTGTGVISVQSRTLQFRDSSVSNTAVTLDITGGSVEIRSAQATTLAGVTGTNANSYLKTGDIAASTLNLAGDGTYTYAGKVKNDNNNRVLTINHTGTGTQTFSGTIESGNINGLADAKDKTVFSGTISGGNITNAKVTGTISGGTVSDSIVTGQVSGGTVSNSTLSGQISGGTVNGGTYTSNNMTGGTLTGGTVLAANERLNVHGQGEVTLGNVTFNTTQGTNSYAAVIYESSELKVNGTVNFASHDWNKVGIENGSTFTVEEGGNATTGDIGWSTNSVNGNMNVEEGGTLNVQGSAYVKNFTNSGTTEILNKLSVATLTNGGTLTVTDIANMNSAATVTITGGTLTVKGTANIGALTMNSGTITLGENHSGNLAVSSLTVGEDGATINANLAVADSATVDFSAGGVVTMGCDVTIGNSIVLTADETVTTAPVTLFTGVDALTLNGTAVTEGWHDANGILASINGTAITDAGQYVIGFWNGDVSVAEASVPEPATATLSLLALAGLAARRRRH